MRLFLLPLCVLIFSANISAQIDTSRLLTQGYFTSPVDHTMKLSGSFGELRSNHFHAGIDIKASNGREGDTIRSAAAGYVSRIKTQRGGYGKVLYIDHPNGYTSVYAHMQRFSPEIERTLRAHQSESMSYEVDIYPNPQKLQVTQGQYIGRLGNTGRSYGPHLHFEIRHTASETPQNPYLHGLGPEDKRPPLMYAVAVQGMDMNLNLLSQKTKYITKSSKGIYGPSHTFEVAAWRVGMTIQTFDLMDGASNKNGVYHLKMYLDDTLHYEMKMDSIGWDETKYINSFIEYKDKKSSNRTMIRCYKHRGNPLSIYRKMTNNGFFKILKNKSRKVRFEAVDFYGNISTYICNIKRKESEIIQPSQETYSRKILYNKSYDLRMGSCNIHIPKGSTDNEWRMDYNQSLSSDGLQISIGKKYEPLFKKIKMKLPLSHIPIPLRSKVVLIYTSGKSGTSFGGMIVNDSLSVNIDKLGDYHLVVDTIPPTITSLEYSKNIGKRSQYVFRLRDNYNTRGGAQDVKYDAYIDDQWTICPLKALGDLLTIPLSHLSKGPHLLRVTAEDHSGNKRSWEREIVK